MKKRYYLTMPVLFLASCASGTSSSNISKPSSEGSNTTQEQTSLVTQSDTLVVYFSVIGHTKTLAEYAQDHLASEIFEIVPKTPYSAEDIDYNSDCRANREQNDASARPEIQSSVADIAKYDTIVLGYPIWWGQAPKVLYTFMESYDFANKTILPFCTSGSSPIGSSALNLAASAPNATWLEGRRFAANTSQEEIGSWLDQYIEEEKDMTLTIDEKKLDVTWENNASVEALKGLTPLTIEMQEYGGFEQTGMIGQSIVRNDSRINVVPGDIVLYNGNQISVFYNSSSWSYTRLGHINLGDEELNTLLNKEAVTFTLKGE